MLTHEPHRGDRPQRARPRDSRSLPVPYPLIALMVDVVLSGGSIAAGTSPVQAVLTGITVLVVPMIAMYSRRV
ncbi:hypothetical protein [Streptomyces sp. NRRL B-24484]|uniref:hypothetical protein n=1 Tax=Streptomyces sp. NRRL B-24484 TaxID=1463833 RepID=UPI001331C3E7|nr:hypothetical protein [Streptomyces sp. NRRL B-24484]